MRTRPTIVAIVLAAAAAAVGTIALPVLMLGWPGLTIGTLGATTVFLVYRVLVQPWQHRWGATDEDVCRAMPGDDLVPAAASTTRAITIAAPPEQVWPWLVQLGYGRAGWYSYDWIDNDSRPSADRILLVAGDQQAGSWCLALYPTASGSRLVSRWRVNWPLRPATAFWILVSDPGAFIMERKMLKGIRTRVERPARSADSGLDLDQHQVDVVAAAARLRRPRPHELGIG